MGRGAQIDFNYISENKPRILKSGSPVNKKLDMETVIKKVKSNENINLNDQEVEKITDMYKDDPGKAMRRCKQLSKMKIQMADKGVQSIDKRIARLLKNEAIRNNTKNLYSGKVGKREDCEIDTMWMFFAFIYIIDELIE